MSSKQIFFTVPPRCTGRASSGRRIEILAHFPGKPNRRAPRTVDRAEATKIASGNKEAPMANTHKVAILVAMLMLGFGLGLAATALVRIDWPSGRRSEAIVESNQFLTIDEAATSPVALRSCTSGTRYRWGSGRPSRAGRPEGAAG